MSVIARSEGVHFLKDVPMKGHMQGLGGMTAVWVIPLTSEKWFRDMQGIKYMPGLLIDT